MQNIEGKTLFCFTDYVSCVITIGSDALSFVLVKKIECDEHIVKKHCDEHIVGCPIKPHNLTIPLALFVATYSTFTFVQLK